MTIVLVILAAVSFVGVVSTLVAMCVVAARDDEHWGRG